jgi:5'-nucleotidase (lipoprotein e(P4) family)
MMRTRAAILACGVVVLCGCKDHAQLLSQQGSDAVLWQNTSAEAYRLYQQTYEFAAWRLEQNIAQVLEENQIDSTTADRRPLAVIVDIDETVLDNSPYQVNAIADGRTFDPADWKAWTDQGRAKASPGAVEFLQFARSMDCAVFYISNRDTSERRTTLRNLDSLAFPFADEAHLLLMEGASDKTERRARVAATHRVVLLVGDQLRDFDERFKDRSVNYGRDVVDAMSDTLGQYFILLPNPMYGTYRDAIQGKGTDAEKHDRMKQWFINNSY